MPHVNKTISGIVGIEDPAIADFILNIKQESKDALDFHKRINELNVGLPSDQIDELYIAMTSTKVPDSSVKSERLDDTTVKEQILKVLKVNLGLDDPVVGEFILNIVKEATSLNRFIAKLDEMDIGLEKAIATSIYQIANPTSTTIKQELLAEDDAHGLSIPNQEIKWEDIKDNRDLLLNDGVEIEELDRAPILNKVYKGRVRNITSFGCFVQILGLQEERCDGLVHISQLSNERVRDPHDVVRQAQKVFVKILKLQSNGKISLSMKNIDQGTGKDLSGNSDYYGKNDILDHQERGRSSELNLLESKIQKRTLTSPERWEIRQLIASGAASSEDYAEFNLESSTSSNTNEVTAESGESKEKRKEEEQMDVEMNTEDQPEFLKGELEVDQTNKYEMPKIVKVPKGSMNRVAINGSNVMKNHREEKSLKKREIEQRIRKKRAVDDPTKNPADNRKEIQSLRQQLVITAWERNRMREEITYGKRTSLPISAQRQSLPVYKMKDQLIEAVRDNQFLVIVGETGSGKTTQITQYLDDAGFSNHGMIGCTQPRRVAATSVSKRVAEEVGCRVGDEVGYTIRFEDHTSSKTRIKYMTDGMLQIEALKDPIMSKYSVIMLDEAHERTVATDILFALLKQAAAQRPDLRVIVTSATLDSAKFSEYFLKCPVINIPGKTFPVEVLYAQAPQMDYIEAALDSVMEIHINEGEGDILVFLTGQEEIDSCCEILYERVKTLGDAIGELIILPVYSALPSETQSKIFEPTPKDCRKVVFATNIAETSITIDGIYYVVDPGFSKVNTFNPRVGMEQLVVSPISQAQANQRKGRAGRTGPGKCYRLYTESAFYNEMLPNTIPEIQRQNLSHTILMLKAMGINDLLHFDFMDPPPKNLMVRALEELYYLEALDNDGYLTKLGKRMSQFPMEPTLSRVLLSSVTNNCSEEIITIISMLSVQNVFYRPKEKQQEADNKRAKFFHPYGDHLTLLNVYTRWKQSNFVEQFCTVNFLHYRHLKRAKDVQNQLIMIFRNLGLRCVSCHGDPDLIRRTLVTGFFMNAAKRDSQVGYKTITGNNAVGIHPSSALFGKEYEYVIYHSLVLTSREYMSQVTSIEPNWLVELAPHFYKVTDLDGQSRKKAKIEPLYNKFSADQNSWRLSSIRQSRERALGIKR